MSGPDVALVVGVSNELDDFRIQEPFERRDRRATERLGCRRLGVRARSAQSSAKLTAQSLDDETPRAECRTVHAQTRAC